MRNPSALRSVAASRRLAAVLALGMAGAAHAGGPFPFVPVAGFDRATVEDRAFEHARGRIAINEAAGNGNAQNNAAAIATGGKKTEATISQSLTPDTAVVTGRAEARIGGNAFKHAQGLISVNQAAGSGNAQANAIAIGVGAEAAVSIDALDDVAAAPQNGPSLPANEGQQDAVISGAAFQHAQGVVQVNQVAGSGNATTNRFSLVIQPAS